MKRVGLIAGALLLMILVISGCHNARNHRRELREMAAFSAMSHGRGPWQNRPVWNMHGRFGQGMHNGMWPGMGPGMGMMYGRGRMFPGMGMMRGNRPFMNDSVGSMPFGPGRRMFENIPNITDNQKKQIGDLMKKNRDEMKQVMDEFSSKMQNLREKHRKDMLNVLTDDQKKYIESDQFKFHK